ncbi:NAD(P)/FAD-dependent oxidoreductase [Desulfofalx alkaliphila]|uniref:NAD(P)/FAD-dependent oxidoreductase n=1 Tax=Desulfofalx alkaliphila TaxID=105483 RepID=UPI0004E0E8D3|nr:NAD(P)-binding protein [Desulfofalx alkaliphila]
MRVAIIGAGVAGLACALEFEKLGIRPDIYEQRYQVGDLSPYSAALPNIGIVPVNNQLRYLNEKYNIKINPLGSIKKIAFHSPNNTHVRSCNLGSLGHLIKMGQDSDSLHQQLARKLKTPIKFKQHVDYFKIKEQYQWVVLADGSVSVPILMNIWQPTFAGWLRGGFLVGRFDAKRVDIWVDREFAREGFAYLTPFNEKSASIILTVNGLSRQEIHDYWNTFINKLPYKLTATGYFEMEFQTGYVQQHQVKNTLLVGNAGGFMAPFWGQGIFASIISGIEAARCIVQGESYDKKIKWLVDNNKKITHLKKKLDRLDNKGLDLLVKMMNIPGLRNLASAGNYSGIRIMTSLITSILGEDDKGT